MEPMILHMWRCRWARRRLQRYLDADPSAALSELEVRRLQAHLATCQRCRAIEGEYRGLSRALAGWSGDHTPDPEVVARLRLASQRLMSTDGS